MRFRFIVWKLIFVLLFLNFKKVYSFEPVLMFFSNSPEYVKSNGYLISGTVSAFTPTLIYFYHLNDTGEDKKIYIKFSGNAEAFIDFVFSSSENNYFKVGNDVGKKIFKDFKPTKFFINGEYLFEVDFKSKNLVSGYFWVFSNGRLDFESWVGNVDYRYILPTDKKHVKGIFGVGRIITFLPSDMNYMVVGDIPLDGIETNMLLKGSYKVFYHFVVNRKVNQIFFSARGGPSIPIYYFNSDCGQFIYTSGNIYKPYNEVKIFERNVFIRDFITQSIGASFYPVYYRLNEYGLDEYTLDEYRLDEYRSNNEFK